MTEKSFEKAMGELEDIVEKLEMEGQPLSESLKLFEQGVKLARYLRGELEKAESRIEILLKDEKGEMKAEPFSLAGKDVEKEEKDPDEPDDDGNIPF